MVKEERRSEKGRRGSINRRKLDNTNYKYPERRSGQDRRSGKDRRKFS